MPEQLYGIRHHGPGSARAVVQELDRQRPEAGRAGAVVVARPRVEADDAVAPLHLVQVQLQDALLPQRQLGHGGQRHLVQLADGAAAGAAEEVLHELLRDRGGPLGAAGRDVLEYGPGDPVRVDPDVVVVAVVLNGEQGVAEVETEPGQRVRLRVVNTDNGAAPVWVTGAPYRVLAVDGFDLQGPTEVRGQKYVLTAGARADLQLVVPGQEPQTKKLIVDNPRRRRSVFPW